MRKNINSYLFMQDKNNIWFFRIMIVDDQRRFMKNSGAYQKLIVQLESIAEFFSDREDKYVSLLKEIGESRFSLIAGANHGTQEFYQTRI